LKEVKRRKGSEEAIKRQKKRAVDTWRERRV
jgi:hypothetical protein